MICKQIKSNLKNNEPLPINYNLFEANQAKIVQGIDQINIDSKIIHGNFDQTEIDRPMVPGNRIV